MLQKTENLPANIPVLLKAVKAAKLPEEVLDIEAKIAAAEAYMRKSGLGIEEARPLIELKIIARWQLGRVLAAFARGSAGRPNKNKCHDSVMTISGHLDRIKLDWRTAVMAQRIGCLEESEVLKFLAQVARLGELMTFAEMLRLGKPVWLLKMRERKHDGIKRAAILKQVPDKIGPFPLIYADPPWTFDTYTSNNTTRMPDDHYPVMTDDQIIKMRAFGVPFPDIAARDAALFLWCTSSNLKRALAVMEAWGFEYKTNAVWDKGAIGLGLIFRNQHELLLYGSRGEPPKPVVVPPSVFRFKRGKHSEKPPQIRSTLEKMYPKFDSETRIELFCRGSVKGWTTYGYESQN
jgi:N6-adenosine-specific RNA methylase IME4